LFPSQILYHRCVSQLLVCEPGVLNRVSCAGVTELPLNSGVIAGFLNEVKNNSPLDKIALLASFDAPYKFEF